MNGALPLRKKWHTRNRVHESAGHRRFGRKFVNFFTSEKFPRKYVKIFRKYFLPKCKNFHVDVSSFICYNKTVRGVVKKSRYFTSEKVFIHIRTDRTDDQELFTYAVSLLCSVEKIFKKFSLTFSKI